METCQEIINRISEVMDGEAGSVAKVSFYAHLAMCGNCRRYYKQMVAVREATGQLEPEDVPEDFSEIMGFVLDGLESADGA